MIDDAPDTRECLLTWLILTLLNARTIPPITHPGLATHNSAYTAPSLHAALLTVREIEVLRLVTLGLTNAQIADHLFLSRRTVDQHLASIYNRLGVSCRAAATRFAMLNNLCA